QSLLAKLKSLLDPDGPGPMFFDINPQASLANKTFTIAVSYGYHISKTTPFKYDSNIGLGDLAEISASGQFSITGDPSINFTLGIDLSDSKAPKLITSPTLPPPSDGTTTAPSVFTINLNDGAYRFEVHLP